MKYRQDFVTNSSSSSFLIKKKYLTDNQINAIYYHSELGKKLGFDCTNEPWSIKENKEFISGYTSLDNFSMYQFFDAININNNIVMWQDYPFNLIELNEYDIICKKDNEQDWEEYLKEIMGENE